MGKQTKRTKQNHVNNNMRGKQSRKDSRDKRINFDNERDTKFEAWMRGAKAKDCNDVAWYAHNAELLKSAASLPFSTTAGTPIFTNQSDAVPGVMELDWTPFINGGNGSAIQQAANSIYSYIVHANSRNYNYDPTDLMMMILAGANVFAGLAIGIRAYGTARKYDQQNYYTPEVLLKAMGFDAADLRNNLSKAWFDLNSLIAKARQIWIPNVMPVIERWFWMSTNVYMDGNSVKAQYYVFTPAKLYYYDETSSATGSSLGILPWGGVIHTWTQYVAFMDKMLDALVNAQDRGMIFGDILNAYGADKLYAVSDIASDYEVTPVYNAEVLTQIENATLCPANLIGVEQDSNGNFVPKYGALPVGTTRWNGVGQTLLNFHQLTTPTPEQIMVATRLKTSGLVVVYKDTTNGVTTIGVAPQIAGTEFINAVTVHQIAWSGTTPTRNTTQLPLINTGGNVPTGYIFCWSAFDWAPWIYQVSSYADPSTLSVGDVIAVTPTSAFGDYDNYTVVDPSVLQKMHTTAVYSEFGVPISL